ncbi:MAG: hypothetical protein Q9225_000947 [Loekoesia sp. 1 TL-2023]
MAELATAGSVIALISLGIQCCDGLTTYYSNYRSYSDEINQISQHIDELKIVCHNLERELQRRTQTIDPTAQQAIRLIANCRNNIQKLDDTLNQCRTTQLPQNFAAKIQMFRAKALYPFKKRTLQTLEEAVESVQRNLGSALQTLQLTFLDPFVVCVPDAATPSIYWVWLNQLVDDGAQFCNLHAWFGYGWGPFRMRPIPDCLEVLYALNSSDLCVVVSHKSEQEMRSILIKDPQSINKPNQWGQTPLHLAVGWPLGVGVLIKNGANIDSPDGYGCTPLSYALAYGFAETVGILMKAGCNLNIARKYLEEAIEPYLERPRSKLRHATLEGSKAALTAFITSLAERRRQLYESLAAAPVPKGIDACWVQSDRVLDEHVSCAEDALKYYDIYPSQVSVHLFDLRTVYHVVCLTMEIAEELWQAGFHDINAPDEYSQRPLTMCRYLGDAEGFRFIREIKLMTWLVERGANIYSPMTYLDSHHEPIFDITDLHPERRVLHHVAANIGDMIAGLDVPAKLYEKPLDTCEDWLTDEIIRFNTFQKLNLRHTCCKHEYMGLTTDFTEPEPDEVSEIRDEDSEGIDLLEELMIEFRNERGDQDIITFLQGYWTSRMKEVRRTRGKVDLEKTKEIGVVWNESCSVGSWDDEDRIEELEESDGDGEEHKNDGSKHVDEDV